jgi:hypothetical protein
LILSRGTAGAAGCFFFGLECIEQGSHRTERMQAVAAGGPLG